MKVAITISQEMADDPKVLEKYLERIRADGDEVVSMTVMPSRARWHEEDKDIPIGGKPSETA